jgi:hypothetical protein
MVVRLLAGVHPDFWPRVGSRGDQNRRCDPVVGGLFLAGLSSFAEAVAYTRLTASAASSDHSWPYTVLAGANWTTSLLLVMVLLAILRFWGPIPSATSLVANGLAPRHLDRIQAVAEMRPSAPQEGHPLLQNALQRQTGAPEAMECGKVGDAESTPATDQHTAVGGPSKVKPAPSRADRSRSGAIKRLRPTVLRCGTALGERPSDFCHPNVIAIRQICAAKQTRDLP